MDKNKWAKLEGGLLAIGTALERMAKHVPEGHTDVAGHIIETAEKVNAIFNAVNNLRVSEDERHALALVKVKFQGREVR